MKRTGLSVVILILTGLISAPVGWGGEKEELQLKLGALAQEERAMTAEFALFQAKMQDLQQRFPEVKKEQAGIQEQLKAIEAKEKAEKEAKEKALVAPEKKGK